MKTASSDLLADLKVQWRDNPRLQWGAALVCAILLLQLFFYFEDQQLQYAQSHQQLQERVTRLEALQHQRYWLQRRDDWAAEKAKWLESFRQWDSPDLASSDAHSWIMKQLGALGMDQDKTLQVGQAAPVAAMPGVWTLSAKLDGNTQWPQLIEWIKLLDDQRHSVVIKQLQIDERRDLLRMSMLIEFYFRVRTQPNAGAS